MMTPGPSGQIEVAKASADAASAFDNRGIDPAKPDAPSVELLSRLGLYFSARHVARIMRLFGEKFDRDYDSVVIFLTVAEACLQAIFHLAPGQLTPDNFKSTYIALANPGKSVMLISELTGIPRETVRRKVRKLVDQRQLAVHADGNIYIPASAIIDARMLAIFDLLLAETDQLVRAVTFYDAKLER